MKKLCNYIIVFVLLSFISIGLSENDLSVYASSSNVKKIACNAKLTDSFSEERILVVLDDEASSNTKEYDKSDFNIHGCVDVKDLTSYNNSFQYKNDEDRPFNKVLSIELTNGSKEYVLETINELIKRDDVLYAGPDYEISIASTSPNDYNETTQWAVNSLQLPQAWDFSTGSNEVIVGVMDTGIDGTHPDLQESIVNNLCRDFTSGEEVEISSPVDSNGHGTHVAGIIGAIGNNNVGVTGTNWNVGLVSLRVFNESGSGYSSNVAKAIEYAERTNISILNLSARWYSNWQTYDVALDTIINNYSGLIVCAAGNEGRNNDGDNPAFPASYSCNNIISVGSHDSGLNRYASSNYGSNTVDIYAPGVNIVSTYPENMYDSNNDKHIDIGYYNTGGTSMAAPYVAGVGALLLSINPNLTTQQLRTAILESVDIPNVNGSNPLEDLCVTDGRLNAYNAVKYVLNNYSSSTILNYNTKSLSKVIDSTSTFFNEKKHFLKMDVENAYQYDFTISSSSALEVTLYDSDFNEINVSPASTNGGLTKTFSYYLSVGTYYLQSNYVSSIVSGIISVSIDGEPHTHSYGDTYLWKDGTTHFSKCECGLFITEAHVVLSTTSNKCLLCNGNVDHGLVEINSNSSQVRMITSNGSYILPNGVIVLVYEDLKDYLNGTLLFYDKNLVTQ